MDRSSISRASSRASQKPNFQYTMVDASSAGGSTRGHSMAPSSCSKPRSTGGSRGTSRQIASELPSLSIQEPSRGASRSSRDSRMDSMDPPRLSIQEPSRYDSRSSRDSRAGNTYNPSSSRAPTSSRYESSAPRDSRLSAISEMPDISRSNSGMPCLLRTPTDYGSQLAVPGQSSMGLSRDGRGSSSSGEYEEITTIHIHRKVRYNHSRRE